MALSDLCRELGKRSNNDRGTELKRFGRSPSAGSVLRALKDDATLFAMQFAGNNKKQTYWIRERKLKTKYIRH